MILLDFYRALKFAWQSFCRNFWLSIVTISIIILALLSVSFLLLFNIMTNNIIASVQERTEIYIDLTDQAKLAQVEYLVTELNKLEPIREVSYITPEETLERFRERNRDNPLVLASLESLTSNPFSGSILIRVDDVSQFPVLLDEISRPEYSNILEINNTEFFQARDLIQAISDYSNKIAQFALGLSLFFILIALVVVFNTIQMGIYSHREEIGIMKLVGASNWFIRAPFLIEAIIYSLIAVVVVFIVIYPLVHVVQPPVDNFLGEYTVNLASVLN
ncbi:MAG: permease-like cell division protein FtsX, partial [Candidatus Komeilibacteria bacterium]|nr:permease-like cell division protein FtsX [Candidatus Komeilibacteria bacterium]